MKVSRSSFCGRMAGSAAVLVIGSLASCSLPRETGNASQTKPVAASTPASTQERLGNVTHNGISLNADMTDIEILKAFGMAPDKASKDVARGPDGFSNTYKLGKQTVSITRSVSTGNNVMALGPIEGDWMLGMPDEMK